MDEIFNSWEESLVFDIALRRQYAVSVEERLGWPTHQFHAGILELIANNERGRHDQKFYHPYHDIAEVIQKAITQTRQLDRNLHQRNLSENRDRLFEWFDRKWYKKWIHWEPAIDRIKYWTNQSYLNWQQNSLWDSVVDAERSVYWGSWPQSWAGCYRDAIVTYLAEYFAPSHYAFKAIPFPEFFSMRLSDEIETRIDYSTVAAAIDTQPVQENLPEFLKKQPIITINVSYIFNQGLPCSIAQNAEASSGFIENSFWIAVEGFQRGTSEFEYAPTERDIRDVPSTSIVNNLDGIRARFEQLWKLWLSAGFYSDEGEPTDHFRLAPLQLADRWSLLVDEMPKEMPLTSKLPMHQNLYLGA